MYFPMAILIQGSCFSLSAKRHDYRQTQSGLGIRHHVHQDAQGLVLPDSHHGLVQPEGPILATIQCPFIQASVWKLFRKRYYYMACPRSFIYYGAYNQAWWWRERRQGIYRRHQPMKILPHLKAFLPAPGVEDSSGQLPAETAVTNGTMRLR